MLDLIACWTGAIFIMAAVEMNGKVHPACVNAGNPFHECVEFCFRSIAEKRQALEQSGAEAVGGELLPSEFGRSLKRKADDSEIPLQNAGAPGVAVVVAAASEDGVEREEVQEYAEEGKDSEAYVNMSERQKKFFDLRLKLNAARKANQGAILAERKREEAPEETRGISKQKWYEEKQKRLGKQLSSNGLEMSQQYMLEMQEDAEVKYKKWDKKPAPFGWDVFNQRSLYTAYKKRTKKIPYTMEDYAKAKNSDPDFYRDGTSLQYGKAPEVPEENVDRMVDDLLQRDQSRKTFSRRRKFHEEKDIDSINDRNEHFNRKIERAFGKYTVEIKNNLERGTALPD